jgi:hypothetical protein
MSFLIIKFISIYSYLPAEAFDNGLRSIEFKLATDEPTTIIVGVVDQTHRIRHKFDRI